MEINKKIIHILNTKQLCKLQKDPTKTIGMKIQREMRKIKTPQEYLNIYPTDSLPGKFYGTARKHKLKNQLKLLTIFQHAQ